MRRLPIDISSLTFVVAEAPKPVLDFDNRKPKIDEDTGLPISTVNLLASSPFEMSIIPVKVVGLVGEFLVNDPVRISGLSAMPWANNGKNGVSFWAERIEPVAKAKAA